VLAEKAIRLAHQAAHELLILYIDRVLQYAISVSRSSTPH